MSGAPVGQNMDLGPNISNEGGSQLDTHWVTQYYIYRWGPSWVGAGPRTQYFIRMWAPVGHVLSDPIFKTYIRKLKSTLRTYKG